MDEDAPIDVGDVMTLIGMELRRAQIASTRRFGELLGPKGVAPGQYSVLKLVVANPGRTQSALAEALRLDRSTMVPIIDRLEESGLVRRVRKPSDRRAYALQATPAGEAFLAEIEPLIAVVESDMAARLDAGERGVLLKLLRRVTDSLEATADR